MKLSILTLIALLGFTGGLHAEKYFFQYERELQTVGPVTLSVTNQIGQVTIETHESSQVLVKATKRIRAGKESEAADIVKNIDINVTQTGDKITVATNIGEPSDDKKSFWRKLLGGSVENPVLAVDYEITIPVHSNVTVDNQSGAIKVTGVNGNLDLSMSSGSLSAAEIIGDVTMSGAGKISMDHLTGALTIKSSGAAVAMTSIEGPVEIGNSTGSSEGHLLFGPVTVKQESGKINLQFVEGDIRIKSSSADIIVQQEKGSLDIATYTGSIEVQTALASEHDYFVESASGDINLRIPQLSSGHLQITSQTGDIKSEIPVVVDAMSKRELVGTFGSGGVRISLSSTTGNVTVAQF